MVPPSAGEVVGKRGLSIMVETKTDTAKAGGQDRANISEKVDEILASYTGEKAELIPILQQVQEALGYLPEEAMQRVAQFANVPECTVFGVATFYAQFKFVPTGRNIVRVCRGTACHVKGGSRILKEVQRHLGIKPGESTPNLEYALETVACIGACALAPTMTINNETYGEMTTKKAAGIFNQRSEGKKS
jgi:NADH-quinone oxidoreductase subunit E